MKTCSILTVALVASSSLALAGDHWSLPVAVNPAGRTAIGAVGQARNSANPLEFIGCEVYGYAGGYVHAACNALDAAHDYGYCWTDSPNLINILSGLNGDSVVEFWWNSDNKCSFARVYNGSKWEPKIP